MSDYGQFTHGGASFPLATGGGNTLLAEADPALFHLLDFYAFCLNRHVGPRLMAAAAGCSEQIERAVHETLPLNPEPFLHEAHYHFPLLAAYRKSSKTKDIGGQKHSVDEIDVCYVLPALQPSEAERLLPVLKAVASVIDNRTENGMDPLYTPPGGEAGDHVWQAAGVAMAEYKGCSYGMYEGADGLPYPAVIMQVELVEKSQIDTSDADELAGENLTIDIADAVQDTVSDFIVAYNYGPPSLTSLSPDTGSKAGGTSVTITGTGFVVGTTPTVYFGGTAATDVVVASATSVTCVTPAHDAFDTFAADVDYVAADGQSDTLEAAFEFTTP